MVKLNVIVKPNAALDCVNVVKMIKVVKTVIVILIHAKTEMVKTYVFIGYLLMKFLKIDILFNINFFLFRLAERYLQIVRNL